MNDIKAVLLDGDGVVIKKHDYFSTRFTKEFGKPLKEESISDFFKNDYKLTAIGKADLKKLLEKRLAGWGWEGSVNELLDFWFRGESELDDQVLNTVSKLRKKKIKVYMVSDNEKYRAEYLLKKTGLNKYFDKCYFSCFLGYNKSEAKYFEYIEKELKIKSTELLYFDDDPKNIKVAKSIGINSYVFTSVEKMDKVLNKLVFK